MPPQPTAHDNDNTFIAMGTASESSEIPPPFPAVAVAQGRQAPEHAPYLAQQALELDEFTPGLNPLVKASSLLFLEIVTLKRAGLTTALDPLRGRLEAEIRGFNSQALAAGISASQINAAQYLLCTALDEAVVKAIANKKRDRDRNRERIEVTVEVGQGTEGKAGATDDRAGKAFTEDDWQGQSLLSTFHKDTWGGEIFFDVLARAMEQPASRLYLLELIYLLLSLGFEGKYRLQDRKGSLGLESLRDQLYRQIRLLRGEPNSDLAKKLPPAKFRHRTYAHIPAWLIVPVLAVCLSVTYAAFYHVLENRALPILAQYVKHAPAGRLVIHKEDIADRLTSTAAGQTSHEPAETDSPSAPDSSSSSEVRQ
jgi:type VI secretion system protein ImpK